MCLIPHNFHGILRATMPAVSLAVRVMTFVLGQDGGVTAFPHMLGRAVHSIIAAMRKTKQNTAYATGLGRCHTYNIALRTL